MISIFKYYDFSINYIDTKRIRLIARDPAWYFNNGDIGGNSASKTDIGWNYHIPLIFLNTALKLLWKLIG